MGGSVLLDDSFNFLGRTLPLRRCFLFFLSVPRSGRVGWPRFFRFRVETRDEQNGEKANATRRAAHAVCELSFFLSILPETGVLPRHFAVPEFGFLLIRGYDFPREPSIHQRNLFFHWKCAIGCCFRLNCSWFDECVQEMVYCNAELEVWTFQFGKGLNRTLRTKGVLCVQCSNAWRRRCRKLVNNCAFRYYLSNKIIHIAI